MWLEQSSKGHEPGEMEMQPGLEDCAMSLTFILSIILIQNPFSLGQHPGSHFRAQGWEENAFFLGETYKTMDQKAGWSLDCEGISVIYTKYLAPGLLHHQDIWLS